jgi:tripartite-type tricarboxylate transporter receptor subunit TctC
VPTVAEAGLAGYEASLWLAVVAPAATPPAIVARLNREVNEVLASAEGKEALAAQGVDVEPGAPEALTERIRTDTAKWRGVAAKAGIKAQ